MTSNGSNPTLTGNWGIPMNMRVGPGRLVELPDVCRDLGFAQPLLVTDKGVREQPMIDDLLANMERAGIPTNVFSDVQGDPDWATVEAGIQAFRDGGNDSIIACGGGSSLDTAKAIALMVGQDRPIWDFEDVADNWKRANGDAIIPTIAIPTTAGTGSEVGRASVITNTELGRKVIIFHPRMLPQTAILDPEVTIGLPAWMTAATGLDAFTHCFEAWCAPGFHPMADGIALQGLELIANALPRAYADGHDIPARTHMLAAASMGSVAFQKGLGAIHAISHPVGAFHHTHHGLTNAIVLPYVMRHNESAIASRMGPVAAALGMQDRSFDAVLDWVLRFREQLGIPHTFADINVATGHAEAIGRMGEIDPSATTNPIPVTSADLQQVFENAVAGRL